MVEWRRFGHNDRCREPRRSGDWRAGCECLRPCNQAHTRAWTKRRSRFWSRAPCRIRTASLRSSQFVRARIVWKTADGLVVPVTAVARVSGQYFVFVADGADGKLVARQRADQGRPDRRRQLSRARRHQAGRAGRGLGLAEAREGAPIAPAPEAPAPPAPESPNCRRSPWAILPPAICHPMSPHDC